MKLKTETIERLKTRETYFKNHIKDHLSFTPEYEAAKSINNLLTDFEANSDKIIETFNHVLTQDHYNGSGWFDFKLLLSGVFSTYGIDIQFNDDGSIEKK